MIRKIKKRWISALAILLAIVITGCGSARSEDKKNDEKGGEGKRNTLVYGSTDYTSINPALYEHGEINSLIFSGLTAHNENNEVVADLAKSWDFNEETNEYTFHLREDVLWQDGEPFTAEDVKFTLETIMNPENVSEIASNYEDIEEIQILDENTVVLKLSDKNVAMLDYMTVGILPKHLLEGNDITTDEFNQNPIGTGPYRLTKWEVGQYIELEKK